MPINVAADFADCQRVVVAKGRFYAEHDAPMAQLVERFTLRKGERSIVVNRYNTMTAAALTDGVDLIDSEDLTYDTVTLTSSEYGLKVILTDKMIRQHNDDANSVVGKLLGQAMARYRDQQLCALFAGLTTNTIGAAGTDITLGHIGAAYSILEATPAPKPYVVVVHPYTVKDIWDDLVQHGANVNVPWGGTSIAEDAVRNYIRGREKLTNMPIIADGNLTPDGGDDVVSGCFNREAFALVTQKDWNVERERDASLRGFELVCVADEGFFELVDRYAVQMTFDAAQETA